MAHILKNNLFLKFEWITAGLILVSPFFVPLPVILAYSVDAPTSVLVTVCGNGIIESGEFCDNGADNKTYVMGTGQRYCSTTCLGWAPACGDSIVQPVFGETCDSNTDSCESGGYFGSKACNTTCDAWLDCTSTEFCGDGIKNGNEQCDGGSQNCQINGYAGIQSCIGSCTGWGECVVSNSCGDNIVNGTEICDGNSRTCAVNGYDGNQACNQTCSGWNLCATPEYCGDGIKNGNEQCDGTANCSAQCQITNSGGGGGGGGGDSTQTNVETKVILQGKAYPSSNITVLKNGERVDVVKPGAEGDFKVEIRKITPGVWTFSLWAEDSDKRRSITFSFTTKVNSAMTTTVSGIFLPPTIELDKTDLKKGETLNVIGQTAPKSDVSITINSPAPGLTKTIKSKDDGTWFYAFDTVALDIGQHTARARAVSDEGWQSGYSQSLGFSVGLTTATTCKKKADINSDGKVNLVDFSILLYNWGVPRNKISDINCDGKVNLVDFSIMMYYWTG